MLPRPFWIRSVEQALAENPVCAILGPRQCGKTTLARQVAARRKNAHLFDLETSAARARLENPELVLSDLEGLVVIDEIQRRPALFETLRVLADRPGRRTRFLVLGSASPSIVRGVSESLAGRVAFVDLSGFDLRETGPDSRRALWMRGGFPRSFLASTDASSLRWRANLIRTLVERDFPLLGIRVPPEILRRFWMMLAHTHAQIWNGAELARTLGVSEHTVRSYLDLLTGTYLVRQLQPWHENIGKRQVKSPKVYVRDSGLFHALLGIGSFPALEAHPKFGASWEGFALEQVLASAGPGEAYCWGTHAGAELDLLLVRKGRNYGVEFKVADAPAMTKSLRIAIEDLGLERAWIVYPGKEAYRLDAKVEVIPAERIPETFRALGRCSKAGGKG
jgi:uncharacterized protein